MGVRDRLWGMAFGGPRSLGRDLRRRLPRMVRSARRTDRRVAHLPARGESRGRLLLAYVARGFFRAYDDAFLARHTQFWESMEMARAWAEAGYHVDVIENHNEGFRPTHPYDVVVGVRASLEWLMRRTPGDPFTVFHADTMHWLSNNRAELHRLQGVQERRGESLRPRIMLRPNRSIEIADIATMLGTEPTADTFAFAGVELLPLSISCVHEVDWEGRDWNAVRNSYVWFGSRGLVHKGLDLVLEAFAGMPDKRLYVVGPVREERDFVRAYRKELFETPNIEVVGWVDARCDEWRRLARECLAMVFPSCAEGQSGSVVACMHQGLIPVVTPECSVDVGSTAGVTLDDASVEGLKEAVVCLSDRSPAELESLSRSAWEQARQRHTQKAFASAYRDRVGQVVRRMEAR